MIPVGDIEIARAIDGNAFRSAKPRLGCWAAITAIAPSTVARYGGDDTVGIDLPPLQRLDPSQRGDQ